MNIWRPLALVCGVAVVGCSGGEAAPATAACRPSPFRHTPPLVIAHAGGDDVAVMRRVRETDEAWCAPAPIGQPPYDEGLLDPENVAWSHDHGMAIFTWTVDDPETLLGLAQAGVDAVYTRWPDIARQVFDGYAAENT